MKIGIGLPTFAGNLVAPGIVLDWAREADAAGFHALAVHDRAFHDTWDPVATLAMVAPITTRIRLATAALILPSRDEALVAKQAAMIDLVSDGRLDLGVVPGARAEDFAIFGRTPAGRGRIFEGQLQRLRDLWVEARATRDTGAAMGPARAGERGPTLWVGGYQAAAVERAIRWGDGFIFGAPDVELMADRVPKIKAAAAAAGRADFPVAGCAYIVPTEDDAELDEGERLLLRYYGGLRKPFRELAINGSPEAILAAVRRYEAAGLDVLHLLPVSIRPSVVERLARIVLPAFHR